MGLLSNRISRESLKSGDHIYSWRTAYIYAHHGIYVGDNTVVHFTGPPEQEAILFPNLSLGSSLPPQTQVPCSTCTPFQEGYRGVVSTCLDCFLSGGALYLFEYSVSPALFICKIRGGTCTLAESDPADIVVARAKYLLKIGFGCYNVVKNNCEDFALYCKTGLICLGQGATGQGGQASMIKSTLGATPAVLLRLVNTNVYTMATAAAVKYCYNRYTADIGSGKRTDIVKVQPEFLRHARGH